MQLKEGLDALHSLRNRLIFFLQQAKLEKNYQLFINKEIYLFFKQSPVCCVASNTQLTFSFEIRRLTNPSNVQLSIIKQIIIDILTDVGISTDNASIELDFVRKLEDNKLSQFVELKILLPIEA